MGWNNGGRKHTTLRDGVAIGIATGRRNKKENVFLKEIWSRHHSYFWKTMEIHENKTSLRINQIFVFRSR